MDLLSLRLVGVVGARINVRKSHSQGWLTMAGLDQGSHGCKPSAFTTDLSHYSIWRVWRFEFFVKNDRESQVQYKIFFYISVQNIIVSNNIGTGKSKKEFCIELCFAMNSSAQYPVDEQLCINRVKEK